VIARAFMCREWTDHKMWQIDVAPGQAGITPGWNPSFTANSHARVWEDNYVAGTGIDSVAGELDRDPCPEHGSEQLGKS